MYQYIYDNFLSEKRHAKTLAELENRLTDLGIHGRIDRMHPLKSLRESIEDGLRKGVRTIIVVGDDDTFKKVLDVVPGKNVVMGYIPFVHPSPIADMLGIPEGVAACDLLSARLTETLDIGRVNGQYFLTAVSFPAEEMQIECEGKYRVELGRGGRVSICNTTTLDTSDGIVHAGNPFDGYLEAVFVPGAKGFLFRRSGAQKSVLLLRKIVARATKPFTLMADGRALQQQTAEIDVAAERLRVIIGKGRAFAGVAVT
jgi:diacylglycerol kinase family enzyme